MFFSPLLNELVFDDGAAASFVEHQNKRTPDDPGPIFGQIA